MKFDIVLFGQLAEIAGSNQIVLEDIHDTNELLQVVNTRYPLMQSMKYIIAVNKKAALENTILNENSQLALLPPFSGG